MSEPERLKRSVPVLRDCPNRADRLLAARTYARGSAPRFAILMGHWDRGVLIAARAATYRAERTKERTDGHEA